MGGKTHANKEWQEWQEFFHQEQIEEKRFEKRLLVATPRDFLPQKTEKIFHFFRVFQGRSKSLTLFACQKETFLSLTHIKYKYCLRNKFFFLFLTLDGRTLHNYSYSASHRCRAVAGVRPSVVLQCTTKPSCMTKNQSEQYNYKLY